MWSEEINKKIQDAENSNQQPAYNDKAWDNMELLLDKHLPLKKKRRRFIFWLLPLLLTGTAIFFIIQRKGTKDISISDQKNVPVQSSSSRDDQSLSSPDKAPVNRTDKTISSQSQSSQKDPVKLTAEDHASETKLQKHKTPQYNYNNSKKLNPDQRQQEYAWTQPGLRKKVVQKTGNPGNNNIVSTQPGLLAISAQNSNTVDDNSIAPVSVDSLTPQKGIVKDDKKQEDIAQPETTKTEIKKEKGKASAASKFSLNLSFGPDISGVGIDNPGRLEMLYGIGASYAISKRFTIRTGFFAGSKKYTADSADYHLHYSITNLQKVDADCYVYEIPLTLAYNFPATKKHNWFISGGVSSYLMKKETYEYYYKNSWGQPQSYSRTYKNESSHLFSVINFSGGYQYHFTNRFSVIAEPYIKIPANGIGVGKVKLNSAGVLFTIGFKPFVKEK